MANVESFSSLGGYSAGIPPKLAIDNNSNIVTNVNAPNANVTANRVFANTYYYGNGQPLSTTSLTNGTSNVNIPSVNGIVTVTTNGTSTWTFGLDGNLVLPNIVNPSIRYANGVQYGGGTVGATGATGPSGDIGATGATGQAANIDNFQIDNVTYYSDAWLKTIDGNYNMYLSPDDGNSELYLGTADNGTSLAGFGSNGLVLIGTDGTMSIDMVGSNVNIVTDRNTTNKTWTFENQGFMSIPGQGLFGAVNPSVIALSSQNNLPIIIEVIDTGNSAAQQWIFDNAGNLTAPRKISAEIFYATGTGTAINAVSGNILTNQVSGTQFNFLNGSYTATLTGAGATSTYTLNLPADAGNNGEVLTTDGTGNLSWGTSIAKSSGYVDAGVFITLDNIKATVTTSGNRSMALAAVSTTFTALISGTYGSGGGVGGNATSGVGISVTTSTGNDPLFDWNFGNASDGATYLINDITNSKVYRISCIIGAGYLNNFIAIERL